MPDRWVVALAASAAAGALRPSGVPLALGVALLLTALLLRRPVLLCLAVLVLTSTLASRSLAGLDGLEPGPVRGRITLLRDPAPSGAGVQVEASWRGRHVEVRAGGQAARALQDRLAGERIEIRGEVRPIEAPDDWASARHLGGRLQIHLVEGWSAGSVPTRVANALRRTLTRGARPLGPAEQSLYAGLVIGDDRAQPAWLADDFRGAGLTHLLAVSGQNVAFVLTLTAPVARRLRLWPRLGVTLTVVALFGLMTRFEPSVCRAAAMAAIAATVGTAGQPITRARVLGLAVTALLVIDPLLARAVGFRLSVAAAVSIVALAPRLASVLPGPGALREPLAVTIAAQLAVAPILIASFGPVPIASIPANLLAVPVAGLVMCWGLTAGVAAGMLGAGGASVLHLPTHLLLAWLAAVARRSAALPLGELGSVQAALVSLGLAVALTARGHTASSTGGRRSWPGRVGLCLAGATVAAASLVAQAPPGLRTELAPGAIRWHDGSTDVVVLGGVGGRTALSPAALLEGARREGLGSIDLVVVADGSIPASVVAALEARHPFGVLVALDPADLARARVATIAAPRVPTSIPVGSLVVTCAPAGARLVVEARPAAAGRWSGAPR